MLVINKRTKQCHVVPAAPKLSDAEVLAAFGMATAVKLPLSTSAAAKQSFEDWYDEHWEHVAAIKGFIVDRLSGNTDAARSVSISSDDVLARFVYEHSSCAHKGYRFLK